MPRHMPNMPCFDMPPALRARLEAMYAEPHRHYHALAHIEALLRWLAHWHALARSPRLIEAAIWFHDAVYDTHARVVTMVRATQHHAADLRDADTLLFLDLDLSVLAQPAEVYDAYSRAVRAEFAWVDEARYRAGRTRVLQSFAARTAVYRTPALHAAWEAPARANLARELQALAGLGGQTG